MSRRVATTTELANMSFGTVIEGERGERMMVIVQSGYATRRSGYYQAIVLSPDTVVTAAYPIGYSAYHAGDMETIQHEWPMEIIDRG
jgi:hypothetical protein